MLALAVLVASILPPDDLSGKYVRGDGLRPNDFVIVARYKQGYVCTWYENNRSVAVGFAMKVDAGRYIEEWTMVHPNMSIDCYKSEWLWDSTLFNFRFDNQLMRRIN